MGYLLRSTQTHCDKKSSLAICVANDWLRESYLSVRDEEYLTVNDLKRVVVGSMVVSSPLPVGIFYAELYAILRALLVTPSNADVKLCPRSGNMCRSLPTGNG